MGDTPAQSSSAVRSTPDGQAGSVLNTAYETREIVVAQGIQFTNRDFRDAAAATSGTDREIFEYYQIPAGLQDDFPEMQIRGEQAEYVSEVQRVRFTIRLVTTKDAFKQALETEGLHVIYGGHARYGRGPCFGPNDAPGEDWEQGSDPNTTGIWRTGYPIIGVPFDEIREHGYSFYPVSAAAGDPARSDLHPDIPRRLRRVALPQDLQNKVVSQGRPLAAEYWGYASRDGDSVLIHAGWENTLSTPMDLGATNLRCRCFCNFGCSTFRHNWRILRERKEWRRTETERFAYFNTAPSLPLSTPCWLTALFTYPRRNDYESWYPSLQWSRERASNLIRAKLREYGEGGPWRII